MEYKINPLQEYLRMKGDYIKIKALITTGKDGDFFVTISPTLLVSGYGNTEEEARAAFHENIKLFCDDLVKLSYEQRLVELKKMGFVQQKYHNKNFSKAYIDENGILQGLQFAKLETLDLESAI